MGVIVLAMLSKCRLHCNCTRNTCQLPHFQNLQFLHQYCTRNTWQHSYFKNFLCSAFRLFGTFTFTLANESIVLCVLNILKDYSCGVVVEPQFMKGHSLNWPHSDLVFFEKIQQQNNKSHLWMKSQHTKHSGSNCFCITEMMIHWINIALYIGDFWYDPCSVLSFLRKRLNSPKRTSAHLPVVKTVGHHHFILTLLKCWQKVNVFIWCQQMLMNFLSLNSLPKIHARLCHYLQILRANILKIYENTWYCTLKVKYMILHF